MILQPEPLPKEELDFQLSPSRIAKDAMGVLQRHEAETAALAGRSDLRLTRDIPYGDGPRLKLDLCQPETGGPHPCLVFIHGGFWQEGSKAGSGFAAAALAAAGWAHVGVGYTLAPDARLAEILAEVAQALATLRRIAPEHGLDPQKLVIAGHSAGAHLAAALMAGLGGEAAADTIAGAVLISGVYELAPIAASYVNDLVGMTPQDIEALSPLRHQPRRDTPTLILIGGDEAEAFQWQSRTLASAWDSHLSRLSYVSVPGRDHFDILDVLAQPDGTVAEFLSRIL